MEVFVEAPNFLIQATEGVPAERRRAQRRVTLSPKYLGNGYEVKGYHDQYAGCILSGHVNSCIYGCMQYAMYMLVYSHDKIQRFIRKIQ